MVPPGILQWRFGASAPATGPIEYSPLPSDDHCQASSLPAWRVIASTRSATMKAE